MCHHVHVTLSAEERKDIKKLSGIMLPVYASIVLAAIAVVALSGPPRGELIASSSASTATR